MNLSLFMTGMPVFLSWQLYDITFLVGRVYHQDNQSWKMCKGKGVKEEKCDFIVGMAKAGATISKIVDETERPKSIVTTILRKYRLRVNVFQTKVVVDLQIQRKRQSLMIWGCMFYDGVGPLVIVNGSVTCAKYRRILRKHFLPLVAQTQRRAKPQFCMMTTHQSVEPV